MISLLISCTTDSKVEPDLIHLSVEKRGYYYVQGIDSITGLPFSKIVDGNNYVLVFAHNSDSKQIDSTINIDLDGVGPVSYGSAQKNGFCWPTDYEWVNRSGFKKWCNEAQAEFHQDSAWSPRSLHFKYGHYEEDVSLDFPEEIKITSPLSTDSFSLNEDITVKTEGKAANIFFEFLKVYSFEYDTSVSGSNEYTLRKTKYTEYGVPWGVKVKPYTERKNEISGGTVLDVELFNTRNQGQIFGDENSDLQRTWHRKQPSDRLH
jgi:hypothetical protein